MNLNSYSYRQFQNSLSAAQKIEFREMSINQQKDWYINYLDASCVGDCRNALRKTKDEKETNQRITESEYLKALEVVRSYRKQINDDLNNFDSFDRKNEKEMIITALFTNQNNRVNTAKQLGMSERTLYRKINKYNIDVDSVYP